jgi:hypothetical protein
MTAHFWCGTTRALSSGMSKQLDAIRAQLSIPERILLFCVVSGTLDAMIG